MCAKRQPSLSRSSIRAASNIGTSKAGRDKSGNVTFFIDFPSALFCFFQVVSALIAPLDRNTCSFRQSNAPATKYPSRSRSPSSRGFLGRRKCIYIHPLSVDVGTFGFPNTKTLFPYSRTDSWAPAREAYAISFLGGCRAPISSPPCDCSYCAPQQFQRRVLFPARLGGGSPQPVMKFLVRKAFRSASAL